ncbi:MAG: chorismate synthase, partial [Oscillospiraceae bacterium]|nr:chorismate synthase [Oscillospiraceae bacterium]
MSSIWRGRISFSVFGEACGPAIGVTIDDLPPGEYIDTDMLREQMGRRLTDRTGKIMSGAQMPSIMSGISGCRTTGSPVMALITNNEYHPDESGNAP